jgi:hypothetical protein
MTSETRSGRAARRRSRAASRNHRTVMFRIGLGLLLSLPFHKLVITAVLALAALAGLARENQARNLARLAARDKAQNLRRQGAAKVRPA